MLIVAVGAAALISLAVAVLTLGVGDAPAWWQVPVGIALIGVSRVFPMRLQLGSSATSQDWGEAALIVGLALLSPSWLLVAAAIGLTLGYAWIRLEAVKLFFNVAASMIAVAMACLVLVLLGSPQPDALTAGGASVLLLAAAVSSVTTDVACASAVGLSRSVPLLTVMTDGLGSKALGFVTNAGVGFGVLAVARLNPQLLLLLPPVLWLLHQGYAGRIQARTERRTWQQLATATHSLGELDVSDVTDRAVAGAATLFCADVVEIELERSDGGVALIRGDAAGNVWRGDPTVVRPEPTVFRAPLLGASGASRGELRLCFRSEIRLDERQRLALSTFADSLASALRNAETHEELRSLAERKAHEAAHDVLTGLHSRAHLIEAAGEALAASGDTVDGPAARRFFALVLLDFDHFKEVNDTLGHDAGDELLRRAAVRLADTKRPGEILARLGGDEFALFVPIIGHADDDSAIGFAKERAATLLAAVREPIHLGRMSLSVEASVGIAVTERGGRDATELLRRADVAMYQAKRSTEPVMSYDPERDASSFDRLALLTEMQAALDAGDQLVLNLQPSIELSTGAPLGAEALVRWQHPRRGLLTPGDFITEIEQTDLIGPLTSAVLDMALAACASWDTGQDRLPVAVNLSARSLLDRELPNRVASMLAKHDIAPARLVLEITETAMMSELEIVEDVVDALRGMGVQLSLDDFGTGYSSLTFLARVRVDEVKIDQAFVGNMLQSREAAVIVRTTVELARSLGLRVIAEGVEDAAQRDALAELGCTGAQGFHLYPPMEPERARAAMAMAARTAAARSTATVIPLGPKRAPRLGRRLPHEDDVQAAGESVSELD
jgi:diguanylate cyclase (GGDEF)-like protein